MQVETKESVRKRLNRVEGQVRGIAKMVEADRYCIDVVTQIAAVRAALGKIEEEVIRDHVGHCVADAIRSGDPEDQRRKVDELIEVIGRAHR
jgi:DNA-binding FrmR family transcriptional regulator